MRAGRTIYVRLHSREAATWHGQERERYDYTFSDAALQGWAAALAREAGECELAFVGLIPELSGLGHGKWLLEEAVRRAWRDGVERVHVHTCTLDHPAALSAYRRAGFTPFKRAVERFPDPRLLGILPANCAPQIPLLGTPASAAPRPAS